MRIIARRKVLPVVALVLGVLFSAPTAHACCTSVLCPFAVSSSSGCVGGPNTPVCNVFGCNCNVQCGQNTPTTAGICAFSTPCDGGDALARAQERFDKVDTNDDGAIDQSEVTAWAEAQQDFLKNINRKSLPENLQGDDVAIGDFVAHVFRQADKDKNGTIEPGEFDETLRRGRKRMSKN